MNQLIKIFILTWMAFAFSSCQSQPTRLAPDVFEKAISKSKVQLIDIRTSQEFNGAHIKGAKNIDFYSADFMSEMGKLDKKHPTYIYCASGNRSGQALKQLARLSFSELGDLQGGIHAWNQAQKSIEN